MLLKSENFKKLSNINLYFNLLISLKTTDTAKNAMRKNVFRGFYSTVLSKLYVLAEVLPENIIHQRISLPFSGTYCLQLFIINKNEKFYNSIISEEKRIENALELHHTKTCKNYISISFRNECS